MPLHQSAVFCRKDKANIYIPGVLQKPSRHNNFSASDYLLPSFRQGTPAL
jgi:hypothetical protein